MKATLAIAIVSLMVAVPASAHSGGTDANGCHTNHKTGDYHCHKPKGNSRVNTSQVKAKAPAIVLKQEKSTVVASAR